MSGNKEYLLISRLVNLKLCCSHFISPGRHCGIDGGWLDFNFRRTPAHVAPVWIAGKRHLVLLYNGRTDNMWELSGDKINIVPISYQLIVSIEPT